VPCLRTRPQIPGAASNTGVGSECVRKPADEIEHAKERALAGDRARYRREVIELGFKIES